jgi:hypothetical protein
LGHGHLRAIVLKLKRELPSALIGESDSRPLAPSSFDPQIFPVLYQPHLHPLPPPAIHFSRFRYPSASAITENI